MFIVKINSVNRSENGEQPIRLQNGLLYPRVEVEQQTHSGDEIGKVYDFTHTGCPRKNATDLIGASVTNFTLI